MKVGCTSLHIAARDDRTEIVKLIVTAIDTDPNVQDQVSTTLHKLGTLPLMHQDKI